MFKSLKISAKLPLSSTILILLMIVIIVIGIARLNRLDNEIKFLIDDRYQKVHLLEEIMANSKIAAISVRNMIISPDQETIRRESNQIQQAIYLNNSYLNKLSEIIRSDQGISLLAVVEEERSTYVTILEKISTLEQSGNLPKSFVDDELRVRSDYDKALANLVNYQENLMNQTVEDADQAYRYSRNWIIFIGLLSLVVSGLIAMYLIRSVVPPVNRIVEIAKRVAEGDLSSSLPKVETQDEIGELIGAFSAMHVRLSEIAGAAKAIAQGDLSVSITPHSASDVLGNALSLMAENLKQQIGDLAEGINVIASSSSEIMATVTQLASSTAESAASVSETTSTVEEVRKTAELVNQKAKHVSDSGKKSAQISETGKQSIRETIDGMNRIQEQMELIANVAVKLSDQSQLINDIVSTVNDLAEQSNLLAVNASIEAAKAGDEGRGFAVVAQEIKSLAGQSKEATSQVRNILNDIQKSISSAVMSTEQGNKAVSEGLDLSKNTETTIFTLTDSIREAAEASIQIAASSSQQVTGMNQVADAMESIKSATSQIAASIKQTEQSVETLQSLGENLKALVQKYKVG